MARKSKAASAASEQTENTVVETFQDHQDQVEKDKYLKMFDYGVHVEYVVKDSLRFCEKGDTATMIVKFSHLDFEVPFTASAEDNYEHGRWLNEQALAGAFGEIAPYERPLPTAHDLQAELDKLMTDITLGLATDEELDLARNLRKQIKAMTA